MSQAIIPIGPETHVNSTTAGEQDFATVAVLSNGGWIVAWAGNGDGDDSGVFQQIYNADGSKKGQETLVNTTAVGRQGFPGLGCLPDGGWIVVWMGNGTGTDNTDNTGVFLQVFNADGTRRGGETRVNTTTAGDQVGSGLAVLANGGWVVTWSGPDAGTGDFTDKGIFQQVYSADGSKLGSEVRVNAVTDGYQVASAITALSDGGWVVTWHGGDIEQLDRLNIFQQVYNADGSKRGGEIIVNTTLADGQYNPRVTALTDGRWVVTWNGAGTTPNNVDPSGVYQQVFNADGTKAGGETLVNTTTEGTQEGSSVTSLANGEWIVTWTGPDFGGSGDGWLGDYGIYQQVFNADGTKKGAEVRVTTTTAGRQSNPDISGLPNGEWIVTWSGNGGSDNSGIYQQRFKLEGAASTAGLVLIGTSRADKLVGGAGNDRLSGKLGKDVLTGAAGQDVFVFDTKPNKKTNLDTITDFTAADDTIWLDNKYFKKLGKGSASKPGTLNKKFFKAADKAKDKDDYLVYSKKTGILYYDADGSGAGKAVEIAKLPKKLTLTAADFLVI